jgi:hypothetical protein
MTAKAPPILIWLASTILALNASLVFYDPLRVAIGTGILAIFAWDACHGRKQSAVIFGVLLLLRATLSILALLFGDTPLDAAFLHRTLVAVASALSGVYILGAPEIKAYFKRSIEADA